MGIIFMAKMILFICLTTFLVLGSCQKNPSSPGYSLITLSNNVSPTKFSSDHFFTFYDNQDSSFLFSSQDNFQYLIEDNKSIPFRKIVCSVTNKNREVSNSSQIINLLEAKIFYFELVLLLKT